MTDSPRILIFYAEAGAGHRRAAEAIAPPLIESGTAVALVDAMRFTHPLFRMAYRGVERESPDSDLTAEILSMVGLIFKPP